MTTPAHHHQSFTLARDIAATPDTLWRAWSDPALKRAWFADNDGPGWETLDHTLDFREGGTETGRFLHTSDDPAMAAFRGEHRNATTYLVIEDRARIVFAYTMSINGRVHSASLATVTFEQSGKGTRLTFTETLQGIGQTDGPEGRKHGWTALLNNLEQSVTQPAH